MGAQTKIEWATHTFNPWVGCTKVSPACDHCYAEGWAKRTGNADLWKGERRRTAAANWRQPIKWNEAARAAGERHRVFCASLADVFDNQVSEEWRADLWRLIRATPDLDWLLLTKRPQNITKMLPSEAMQRASAPWPWPNVWLGTTAENQAEADRRIPHLLATLAAVRFISAEPLLGPVDLGFLEPCDHVRRSCEEIGCWRALDWVIVGGESGPNARPMEESWAEDIRDQCKTAGVAFFMKQMTKKAPIPADLMIREFPNGA